MVLTWTEWQKRRLSGEEQSIPWWVNDKLKLSQFCAESGLPSPDILFVWDDPSDISLVDAPDVFVLKPSVMHSAWGVMVLNRTSEPDVFYESLSGRTLNDEQIKTEQSAVYERCKYKSEYKVFIEEKVVGQAPQQGIPFDYKVYCFFDKPMLIQQIDRNFKPMRTVWFDGDFEPLNIDGRIESEWKAVNYGEHVRPTHWREMLTVASRATVILRTPFMSVDMYSSTRGPLIGEMTPAPGVPYYGEWYRFTPAFDAELGMAWALAERRIAET